MNWIVLLMLSIEFEYSIVCFLSFFFSWILKIMAAGTQMFFFQTATMAHSIVISNFGTHVGRVGRFPHWESGSSRSKTARKQAWKTISFKFQFDELVFFLLQLVMRSNLFSSLEFQFDGSFSYWLLAGVARHRSIKSTSTIKWGTCE